MRKTAIRRKPRPSTPEERAWYARIHDEIPCCVLCGAFGVTVAHENQHRGVGQKSPFRQTAALCWTCHVKLDQYRGLTRDESRALMDEAIKRTHKLLGWEEI